MKSDQYLIGFAGLGRLLVAGSDFPVLGPQLEARVAKDPTDANALMDMSTLLFLMQNADSRPLALDRQRRALGMRQIYRLAPPQNPRPLRLLVVMAPGDMTSNTPVDCLLEGADIQVTLLYALPNRSLPALPVHDLVFIAIGESSENQILLRQLAELPRLTTKPIVNAPDRIARLVRDRASALLKSVPGAIMPATVLVERARLVELQRQKLTLDTIIDEGRFPIIARPVDSHGGKNLVKLDGLGDLSAYLTKMPDETFFVANFIDYRSRDRQFKKFRVVLIDGRPFACHLAISSHWMIHYFNASMSESSSKRDEEERFFTTFGDGFAKRHQRSLEAIHNLVGLDFLGIDCAEMPDGKLLIFEVDNAAIVHAFDDPEVFPYKIPAMRKVFEAFRSMLFARANPMGDGLTDAQPG